MTLHAPIEQYMSPHPLALRFDQKVRAARQALLEHGFTSLPVVDATGRLCGIVSATDLLREALDKDLDERPLLEVMTWPVVTEHVRSTMTDAACVMIGNHVHHLVVVDDRGRPVGIISASDIVEALGDSGLRPHISTIMNKEMVSIDAGTSVGEARQVLSDAGLTEAAVTGATEVVGLVDQKMLLAAEDDARVDDVMETSILCESADTPISDAAQNLTERGARRALVLDADGQVLGILTLTDLVSYVAGLAEHDPDEEEEEEEIELEEL